MTQVKEAQGQPLTDFFNNNIRPHTARLSRHIPVQDESEEVKVPIKYMYRLPQYKYGDVRISIGQREYKMRKLLEAK